MEKRKTLYSIWKSLNLYKSKPKIKKDNRKEKDTVFYLKESSLSLGRLKYPRWSWCKEANQGYHVALCLVHGPCLTSSKQVTGVNSGKRHFSKRITKDIYRYKNKQRKKPKRNLRGDIKSASRDVVCRLSTV